MEGTGRKQMSAGVKAALFAAFCGVWLALCFILHFTSAFFREGGWGMWPILAAGLVFVLVTIDRVRYLGLRISIKEQRALVVKLQRQLMQGDVASAIDSCRRNGGPMGKIITAGLNNLHRPDEEVQEAVDEAALDEMPYIEKRTGYLAMIGNVATLLGLLGTIVGLITSFAGVSLEDESDPETQRRAAAYVYLVPQCSAFNGSPLVACIKAEKATILARGISEAMHCTAFGLSVGIAALLSFSALNGRTQRLIDNLTDGTVRVMSLAVAHRQAMRIPATAM